MGSATEASVWSNACEIHDVPVYWRFIPYGFSLTNQRYRVVDEQGRDCPDWALGGLWVDGIGAAEGYLNGPLHNEQQFLTLPNERWYRTGDLGCYWPDGTIEFLGRRDKQVRVGGCRIGLGEIESTLSQLAGVKQVAVLAIGEKEKALAVCVAPQGEAFYVTNHRNPAPPQVWYTPTGMLLYCAISLEISAEQVTDLLQHRLLEPKPGHTVGTGPLPLMNSLTIQPRWQAVVERWLASLVTQRRLKPAAKGYQVCVGKEREGEHPHFSEHDLTLSQIFRSARNKLSLPSDAQWSPESLTFNRPASAPYIQELMTICQ